MSISYKKLDSISQLNKQKFESENWYLMNWGMGDAINATLFLESQSPVPYKISCRPGVFNAVKFILENFVDTPKCQEVEVYPIMSGYPIDQDEVLMSKDGFGPHSIGNAHLLGRLKVMHYPPRDWWAVQKLEESGILQKIHQYDSVEKTIEDKTCILFPEAGDNFQIDDTFWEEIVRVVKDKGYKVFVNWTDKKDFSCQKIFSGTEKLDKLEIQDLCDHLVRHKNLVTIGQRTGIFDFLKFFEFRKIQFYADLENLNRPDPTRALYDWCHLSNDIYTKNNIELKMSEYNSKILDLIIP
jgi:hypothetical protein